MPGVIASRKTANDRNRPIDHDQADRFFLGRSYSSDDYEQCRVTERAAKPPSRPCFRRHPWPLEARQLFRTRQPTRNLRLEYPYQERCCREICHTGPRALPQYRHACGVWHKPRSDPKASFFRQKGGLRTVGRGNQSWHAYCYDPKRTRATWAGTVEVGNDDQHGRASCDRMMETSRGSRASVATRNASQRWAGGDHRRTRAFPFGSP